MMSDTTCKPNFFIVGAPKSGTTSMHLYLAQHPDIHMSHRKEPCFLAPDFRSSTYPQNEVEYLRCFDGYCGEHRVGESTSTYLYSKLAAKRIHEYAPSSKIIVMLRNPVDLVASLHAQRVKEGYENIGRLENALEAEADRRLGKKLPVGFNFPKEYLLYREYGKYAEQLRRYFREFGRDRVHVIIFEEFTRDVEGEVAKVCKFLDVTEKFVLEIRVHNAAGTPRFVGLQRVITLVTPKIVEFGNRLRPIFPFRMLKMFGRAYGVLGKVNMKGGRPNVNNETRVNLALYFRQEVNDIEKVLGRELCCWRVG